MKKLESINDSLFENFKKYKIKNINLCLGGLIHSGADVLGCTDTYSYTARTLSGGGTVNDHDGVKWTCPDIIIMTPDTARTDSTK